MNKTFSGLMLLAGLIAPHALAEDDFSARPIPLEFLREDKPEFRENKSETPGDKYQRNHQAKAKEDEWFCGFQVRNDKPMRNSVYEVHAVDENGAIFHVSVGTGSNGGEIVVNFDTRYVKKAYFKDRPIADVFKACETDGWSMHHAKRSEEIILRNGAAWECRGNQRWCISQQSGEYFGCGTCP